MTSIMSPPTGEPGFPLGAQCVRTLLERQGIPKHKHSVTISEVLHISYSQARRKAAGESPWTLEELEVMGAQYGESVVAVVLGCSGSEHRVPASLHVGNVRVRAYLWPGEQTKAADDGGLVAVKTAQEWLVLPGSSEITDPCFEIKRLLLEPEPAHQRRVAVLDDDLGVADTLSASFVAAGIESKAYYAVHALEKDLRQYDAFVLDWLVGKETTRELIAEIRSQVPEAPVFVLTGQMNSGVADQSEVASVMTMGVTLFEKPLKFQILKSAVIHSLTPKR